MRIARAWICSSLILVSLSSSGRVEAAGKENSTNKAPIPSDVSLGFSGVTRDELLSRIRRVGILPVDLPEKFRDRDDARLALQDAVMTQLRAANFDVVGPAAYQESFDRLNRELGGMYDASTGELKREIAVTIRQRARREFASKERLDGFVYLGVQPTTAQCDEYYASWDGVHETSNGKPPKSAFVEATYFGQSAGTLPALTLLLQITNTGEQVMLSRSGGIQLVSYLGRTSAGAIGSGIRFLDVASAELLKDSQRIDRAVRVATLPLVHTPQEISLGDDDSQASTRRVKLLDLPPPPPAQAAVTESALRVPRDQILQSVHRVAVASVETSPFEVSAEVRQQLVSAIKLELAPLNWEVMEAPNARELLDKALRDARLFDSLTGKRDDARDIAVRKSMFTALGLTPAPDAILWPKLVRVAAVQDAGVASWDGANQNAFTLVEVPQRMLAWSYIPTAGTGEFPAMSIELLLADANLTQLYRSRGGVQVLRRMTVKPGTVSITADSIYSVELAPGEILNDYVRQRAAVEYALRELVLTPEALAAKSRALKAGKGKNAKKKQP